MITIYAVKGDLVVCLDLDLPHTLAMAGKIIGDLFAAGWYVEVVKW